MMYCLCTPSMMLARITAANAMSARSAGHFSGPRIAWVHKPRVRRACVQVCFHVLEDEVDVFVVLSLEHVEEAAGKKAKRGHRGASAARRSADAAARARGGAKSKQQSEARQPCGVAVCRKRRAERKSRLHAAGRSISVRRRGWAAAHGAAARPPACGLKVRGPAKAMRRQTQPRGRSARSGAAGTRRRFLRARARAG